MGNHRVPPRLRCLFSLFAVASVLVLRQAYFERSSRHHRPPRYDDAGEMHSPVTRPSAGPVVHACASDHAQLPKQQMEWHVVTLVRRLVRDGRGGVGFGRRQDEGVAEKKGGGGRGMIGRRLPRLQRPVVPVPGDGGWPTGENVTAVFGVDGRGQKRSLLLRMMMATTRADVLMMWVKSGPGSY